MFGHEKIDGMMRLIHKIIFILFINRKTVGVSSYYNDYIFYTIQKISEKRRLNLVNNNAL